MTKTEHTTTDAVQSIPVMDEEDAAAAEVATLRARNERLRAALLALLAATEPFNSLWDDESRAEVYADDLAGLAVAKDNARATLKETKA